MKRSIYIIIFCIIWCACAAGITAAAESSQSSEGGTAVTAQSGSDKTFTESGARTVSAVIYPHQSATIGTEVRGILNTVNYKEGRAVEEGGVVAEVSRPRYEAIVGEFQGNLDAVKRTLEQAREEARIQREIYEKRANTFHEVVRADYEVKILEARLEEGRYKLDQAKLNLDACILKAPFSGTIAVLYKDQYEPVDHLEKVFELIDTSLVYARANWPEARLSELEMGRKAVFTYGGEDFTGAIKRISGLIDPASRTKRVHVLIDNSEGKLQVGMSGTLRLKADKKVSALSQDRP